MTKMEETENELNAQLTNEVTPLGRNDESGSRNVIVPPPFFFPPSFTSTAFVYGLHLASLTVDDFA